MEHIKTYESFSLFKKNFYVFEIIMPLYIRQKEFYISMLGYGYGEYKQVKKGFGQYKNIWNFIISDQVNNYDGNFDDIQFDKYEKLVNDEKITFNSFDDKNVKIFTQYYDIESAKKSFEYIKNQYPYKKWILDKKTKKYNI